MAENEGKEIVTEMITITSQNVVAEITSNEQEDNTGAIQEEVTVPISNRSQKKIMNGMGLLLQQLRSTTETSVQEEAILEKMSVEPQKLNRKERRALLQKQYVETCVSEKPIIDNDEPPADNDEPPVKMTYQPIIVNYSTKNPQLAFKDNETFKEVVPTFGFAYSNFSNNYVKQVSFSPDGHYLASTSQDRVARIFRFNELDSTLSKSAHIPLGDLPYDAVWHPCGEFLATTSRLHPIHFWNTSGEREASYRGIDHLDELVAAQTIAFSNDGLRMYAGYNKCIRIWDVRKPGRHHSEKKTWRKQPYPEGQKGIVSSITVHPYFDGTYAVATFGSTIGLYSDRTDFVECLFSGDFSAVTHIKYSSDGMKLYCCGRKTGSIQCFDMRNPGKILFTLRRPFETQQKVFFDVARSDQQLFSGTSNGEIVVFDLKEGDMDREPISTTKISASSVPCVSLHPTLPLIAACTGERVFPFPQLLDEDNEENELELSQREYLNIRSLDSLENNIQLWNYSE